MLVYMPSHILGISWFLYQHTCVVLFPCLMPCQCYIAVTVSHIKFSYQSGPKTLVRTKRHLLPIWVHASQSILEQRRRLHCKILPSLLTPFAVFILPFSPLDFLLFFVEGSLERIVSQQHEIMTVFWNCWKINKLQEIRK